MVIIFLYIIILILHLLLCYALTTFYSVFRPFLMQFVHVINKIFISFSFICVVLLLFFTDFVRFSSFQFELISYIWPVIFFILIENCSHKLCHLNFSYRYDCDLDTFSIAFLTSCLGTCSSTREAKEHFLLLRVW